MHRSKPRGSPPPLPTPSRAISGIRPKTETPNTSTRYSVIQGETLDADSEPTRPHRGLKPRVIAERVLATSPSDLAVLRTLKQEAIASREGSKEWARYNFACMLFVERLIAP